MQELYGLLEYINYYKCVNDLVHSIYDFQENNEDFGLSNYNDILNESGVDWGTESMETADVSNFDARTIMEMLIGTVRAERFCDGALLGFLKSGAIPVHIFCS